jgi:hypothetical protein
MYEVEACAILGITEEATIQDAKQLHTLFFSYQAYSRRIGYMSLLFIVRRSAANLRGGN